MDVEDVIVAQLVIQLKRFRVTTWSARKQTTAVSYPVHLSNMLRYCSNPVSAKINETCALCRLAVQSSPHKDEWYHFSDTSASPVKLKPVTKSTSVYVLFYALEDISEMAR
ncbi:MAG: hypothetical protein MHM6MM_006785 [Cercozoa sp. M6MM]